MTPALLEEIKKTLSTELNGSQGLNEHQKRVEILGYALKYNCNTFIETGTNRGDTVEAMRHYFDQVYSIEIGPNLFEAAVRRFAGIKNVYLSLGDAREVLPKFLMYSDDNRRILFYLDAHCQYDDDSPDGKAFGTSVPAEIETIRHLCPNSVVLIDDARLFQPATSGIGNEYGDWPDLAKMLQGVEDLGIWDIDLKNDIIRLTPKS